MASGYMGQMLNVDLTSGAVETEPLSDPLCQDFVGGYGIAARLLYERMPAGADPLGPDNILGLLTGPLTGTRAVIGSRFVAVAKSPKTAGGWGDANCGGFFGPHLKFAGFDGVLFSGIAPNPVYLFIDEGKAELLDASDLWGLGVTPLEDILKERHGKGVQIYLAPTADSRETWQATLRHIACEGRCFVLGCNQFVTKSMYPADLPGIEDLADQPEIMCRGGSVIVMGELGVVDEDFSEYESPALARLLGIRALASPVSGKLSFSDESPILADTTVELDERYGYVQIEPDEGTTVISRVAGKRAGISICAKQGGKRIYINSFSNSCRGPMAEVVRELLDYVLGDNRPLTVTKGESDDIEVHLLCKGTDERLVLAINWTDAKARVKMRIPSIAGSEVEGKYIADKQGSGVGIGDALDTAGKNSTTSTDLLDTLLLPYEARVLRLKRPSR